MAIGLIEAVLYRMPELKERGPALVLLAICDSADRENGWTYWKSARDLMSAARLSRRGLRDAVRFLERERFIRTELKGEPGRLDKMRFRALFDLQGIRADEAALYPQPPATTAGGKRRPPATTAAPPATTAAPPATTAAPPATTAAHIENGLIRPSPSISKERLKNARGRKTEETPEPPITRAEARTALRGIYAKLGKRPPAERAP